MEEQPIRLDDDGVPLLETPVASEALAETTSEPVAPIDLSDPEQLAALLEENSARQILDDITEDLQKLVSWKIESLVKDEVCKMVHSAIEESAPKLAQDIRTQLQLALPDLLAQIGEKLQR